MLPKLVTETADFGWNDRSGHFESKIFSTDPETLIRELQAFYATPPTLFLQAHIRQGRAIKQFFDAQGMSGARILNFPFKMIEVS